MLSESLARTRSISWSAVKRAVKIAVVGILTLTFTGCDALYCTEPEVYISEEVGIDISAGTLVEETDSHGGFHGDGTLLVVIRFSDDAFRDAAEQSPSWRPLAENRTMLRLAEFSDLPAVENGLVYFRDRNSDHVDGEDEAQVLRRASYNYTLAVYDVDARTLYYVEEDT